MVLCLPVLELVLVIIFPSSLAAAILWVAGCINHLPGELRDGVLCCSAGSPGVSDGIRSEWLLQMELIRLPSALGSQWFLFWTSSLCDAFEKFLLSFPGEIFDLMIWGERWNFLLVAAASCMSVLSFELCIFLVLLVSLGADRAVPSCVSVQWAPYSPRPAVTRPVSLFNLVAYTASWEFSFSSYVTYLGEKDLFSI